MVRKKPVDKELDSKYVDLIPSGNGRPKKIINEDGKDAIRKLSTLMCTDEEIAAFLGVSVDTLTNKNNVATFTECKKEGQSNGKISLRRQQMKAAEAGNVSMLIWLGKQHLGQTEKQEMSTPADSSITFNIKPASKRPAED